MVGLKLRLIREHNRIYTALLKIFWHLQGRECPRVYMFHSILNDAGELYSKFSITTSAFEKFLEKELAKGQRPLTEEELICAIDNPTEYKNRFAVTFDDIYDSVYTNAYPVLKRLNIPFVVFITPGLIGKIDANPKSSKQMITMDHLMELLKDPLCILGSHGMSHVAFRTYSGNEDLEALCESKHWLETSFNTTVRLFAFPYGRRVEVSGRNISKLSKSGYSYGFSALNGTLAQKWLSGRWFLPRILVDEEYVKKH